MSGPRRAPNGFTLIELLLVLLILTTLAAMSVPRFTAVSDTWGFDADVRALAADLRRARWEAVNGGTAVSFDPPSGDRRTYRLVSKTDAPRSPSERVRERRDGDYGSAEVTVLSRALPPSIRLQTPSRGITFLPDGSSTGGWVDVLLREGDERVRLLVDPVVGAVSWVKRTAPEESP